MGRRIKQHGSHPVERGEHYGVLAGSLATVSGLPHRQAGICLSTEMKEGDQTIGLRRQRESIAKHHGRQVKEQVLESSVSMPET